MSILPRTFIEGKRCLIYCGDERCNCDKSPYHPKNIAFDLDLLSRLMLKRVKDNENSKCQSDYIG